MNDKKNLSEITETAINEFLDASGIAKKIITDTNTALEEANQGMSNPLDHPDKFKTKDQMDCE